VVLLKNNVDTKELVRFIKDKIQTPTNDVFPIEFDSQRFWVKKAKVCGSNALQHIVYKLFKNPLLIPSKKQSPIECIYNEAGRLDEIYKKFSHVPHVLVVEDDFMVMSDTGKDLRTVLESKEDDLKTVGEIIYKALGVLVELHSLGFFHGGSQIKNLTMKDDEIYMVDFEEKFIEADIEELQFRDLFLFLISIAKLKYEFDYKNIIDTYIEKSSKEHFYDKFKKLHNSVSFLMKLLDNDNFRKKMDKDTQSVYKLFKQIS
jgi:tRNA A-37 threonylcarbamoyl transferase component Bud32